MTTMTKTLFWLISGISGKNKKKNKKILMDMTLSTELKYTAVATTVHFSSCTAAGNQISLQPHLLWRPNLGYLTEQHKLSFPSWSKDRFPADICVWAAKMLCWLFTLLNISFLAYSFLFPCCVLKKRTHLLYLLQELYHSNITILKR